jgi:hypothetical protein
MVLGLIAGGLMAPELEGGDTRFHPLLATSAQVVGALLVVIAVEVTVTTFRGLDLNASDVRTGLAGGCASLVAFIAALSPSLPDWVYEPLFAIGVGSAAAAVATVIVVALPAIDQAREAATVLALQRRARLGQKDARKELLERGEEVPEPITPSPSRPERTPRSTGS